MQISEVSVKKLVHLNFIFSPAKWLFLLLFAITHYDMYDLFVEEFICNVTNNKQTMLMNMTDLEYHGLFIECYNYLHW